MNLLPSCILYTQDAGLARRISGFLTTSATVQHLDRPEALQGLLERDSSNVVLMDIRGSQANDMLPHMVKQWPASVVIVLGVQGSEPLLRARTHGVYAIEDIEANRQRLQVVTTQAMEHLKLREENRILREEATRAAALKHTFLSQLQPDTTAPLQPSRHFPGALRQFDNVEALLQNLVEGVAGSVMVSRVGIFCRARESRTFRLRASLRCLEDTRRMEYTDESPLVQWLTINAHLVARDNLEHVRDTRARTLLGKTLDIIGAEVLVPLQVRERLLGWMFVGHRATGMPFGMTELENLALIAEHVSTTLENALLYEEVAVQKSLAETLLHSMPTGIVAVDEEGVVRWFNSAAEMIFDTPADAVVGQPVEQLGTRITGLVHDALAGDIAQQPEVWMETRTKRTLSVQTRRLEDESVCLGAVALVQDITVEQMLEEKQEQLERASFWTELAAAMSHEIRNPLVAIKTFAQLLPERYEDEEFRAEFSRNVDHEVDRLNSIIDQIDRFAHPGEPTFKRLDIRHAVKGGLDKALQAKTAKGVWVDTAIDEDIPMVEGDEEALADCFAHLITNAMEALAENESPRIVLTAREYKDGDMPSGVSVSIQDNAGGIKPSIRSKVFSPFCTTKARGMGLGLPIVKRTVVDHSGRVHIESTANGTCVTILLPGIRQEGRNETHPDRRRRARKS